MSTELEGRISSDTVPNKPRKVRKQGVAWKPITDICSISTEAFYLNIRRADNIVFTTSLYKID